MVRPKPRCKIVSKDNLGPHMIRASVDLRISNKYMERNQILQSPVVEYLSCKFHDGKVFFLNGFKTRISPTDSAP